jgi:hypothetical protein
MDEKYRPRIGKGRPAWMTAMAQLAQITKEAQG